ncbi:MAG: GDSL-type esterase/lipase family protein [bacterium]
MSDSPKRILCYGDSNTWGSVPLSDLRYSDQVRWPKILQKTLGDSFDVIEQGLGGRTIAFDDQEGEMLGLELNGFKLLERIIVSQLPLEYVIVMLGTNDVKVKFNASVEMIIANLKLMINTIKQSADYLDHNPQIVVSSIAAIHPQVNLLCDDFLGREGIVREINSKIKNLAVTEKIHFFDGFAYTQEASADGLHFTKQSHIAFGENLSKKILELEGKKYNM